MTDEKIKLHGFEFLIREGESSRWVRIHGPGGLLGDGCLAVPKTRGEIAELEARLLRRARVWLEDDEQLTILNSWDAPPDERFSVVRPDAVASARAICASPLVPDRLGSPLVPDAEGALQEVLADVRRGRALGVIVIAVDAEHMTRLYGGGRIDDLEALEALVLQMKHYVLHYEAVLGHDVEDADDPDHVATN